MKWAADFICFFGLKGVFVEVIVGEDRGSALEVRDYAFRKQNCPS